MRPWADVWPAVLFASLVAFGLVADRALVAQGAAARAAAESALDETARLVADGLRATLRAVEEAALDGRPPEAVVVERLAVPSGPPAVPAGTSYSRLSRRELAGLLDSNAVTFSGLPEAVVARLALGETGRVSAGDASGPDVGARLLAGELPVRPEDVAYLARALGVYDAARVQSLVDRLQRAPSEDDLPRAPGFARRRNEAGSIVGWTVGAPWRLRYEIGLDALIDRAGLRGRARVVEPGAVPSPDRLVPLPEVAGLVLRVAPDTSHVLRLQGLRAALWLAVLVSSTGLLAVRRALVREARANTREKAFLAGVTHELRSPVASLRLLAETLAEGRGDARDYGALMARESERLEGLVERVLSAARVEAAPNFAPVAPREIMDAALLSLRTRAARRQVAVDVDAGILPPARWDGEAVGSALRNLVENAIEHGREGGRVLVSARAEGNAVRFAVRDDGPGIVHAERGSIFGRFSRGRTKAPGAGLGLYLVDQVAAAHGGRVELETEVGRGSTFTLILPLDPRTAGEATP